MPSIGEWIVVFDSVSRAPSSEAAAWSTRRCAACTADSEVITVVRR